MEKEIKVTKALSNRIKELIRGRDKTFRWISAATGVSSATLSRLCNGKSERVHVSIVKKLSLYFGEDLEKLSTDDSERIEELLDRIVELEKENRTLKELLVKKWGGE